MLRMNRLRSNGSQPAQEHMPEQSEATAVQQGIFGLPCPAKEAAAVDFAEEGETWDICL